MKKRLVIILLALCAVTPVLKAQSLWTSAEVRVKATICGSGVPYT